MKQFHLGIDSQDLQGAKVAIVPGDPERVQRIAEYLERPTFLASHREFTSYLGWFHGTPVVVCSTGIGGPSTSIAIEELAQLGVQKFLRIGTTGAIHPDIKVGELIVSQASVRLDGASQHFAPMAFPASSDFYMTRALVEACEASGQRVHVGVTASSDTFYPGQERYDTNSGRVASAWRGSMEEWQSMGVLNYEMESATLFTMCATEGLQAGCVAGVLINRNHGEIPNPQEVSVIETKVIKVAFQALKNLIIKS
jgi:uridine phosphorylase